MKNSASALVAFFLVVSMIGFVLPWWSLFVLCFFWGYLGFSKTSHMMVGVFLSHAILIAYFGDRLLKVMNFGALPNNGIVRDVVVCLIAFVFSTICGLIASCARDLKSSKLSG